VLEMRVWEILEILLGDVILKRDGKILGSYDLDNHREYDYVLNKYHQDIVEEIFADKDDLIVILKGSNV
jgi:hypothetical protein